MNIQWTHTDTKKVRLVRASLQSGLFDLKGLEDLLSTLEGKIENPSVPKQKRRKVKKGGKSPR